ncbi:GntR family transcriptional regulator [Allokutzneria sp. A3M-2-11 16]|uniref:GntR family transcriptional regulator n=1 Tax=Allokutzneria sp. A3M-2-11 16 TaxID=2962043 RepID=UPI0020B807A2|nr:GntR family transcriptional regulator [Allokutzneria sp. A3M-2-11 16]MCP3801967.1 GntR family transcriptional regulator [Allokutzneria sp. A3M-2-11 16]
MRINLRPIQREVESLADLAYRQLSEAMLTGQIPPGHRLVMDQLAEQLGISRTPVRDALLRLQRENLVEPTGKRGFVVCTVAVDDAVHVYETREAIEAFAARRVAEIGEPAIEHVRRAIVASKGADTDPRRAFEANMSIHRSVVEATGNPPLLELFDDVWQRARGRALFADFLANDTERVPVDEAHAPLLTALRESPEAGYVAMCDHIRSGLRVHQNRP